MRRYMGSPKLPYVDEGYNHGQLGSQQIITVPPYSSPAKMRDLEERGLIVLGVHVVIHLVPLTFIVYLLGSQSLSTAYVLGYGALATIISLLAEWLLGPSLISSLAGPRWIAEGEDPIIWALVEGEARKLDVRVPRVGVIDHMAPNALVYSSPTGRPMLLFTRGLLVELTHGEVRCVAVHLMCRSRGWVPSVLTTVSGFLTVFNLMSRGYMRRRAEGQSPGLLNVMLAGWGHLFMNLVYPFAAPLSRQLTVQGDEAALAQTGDPSSYLRALMKASAGLASRELDLVQVFLGGHSFVDPTAANMDTSAVRNVAGTYGINLGVLLGYEFPTDQGNRPQVPDLFKRLSLQPRLSERLSSVIEMGRTVETPIKLGLAWIE
jgi:Zn-dependent protease with chaperone function